MKEFADISISDSKADVESLDRSDNRPIVQWLPEGMAREAVLFMPQGEEIAEVEGFLEDFELQVGQVYQLERVGFARLERLAQGGGAELVWLHS